LRAPQQGGGTQGNRFHIEIESFKQEEKWNESRFMWKSCAPKQGGGGERGGGPLRGENCKNNFKKNFCFI